MPNYVRSRWGQTYFFTIVTFNRQRIFNYPELVPTLRYSFKEVMQQRPFTINAAVILPDHIHCIWTLPEGDIDYSARWSIIKRLFTQYTTEAVRTAHPTVSRLKRREGLIWQRRFWEHQIRNDRDYRMHCDYIHYNPVKHGLANAPRDWPHSSFNTFVSAGYYETDWGDGNVISFDNGIGHE
jgi:putative transposase